MHDCGGVAADQREAIIRGFASPHRLAKETRHLRRAPSLGRKPHKGGNHNVRLIRCLDGVLQFTQRQAKLGYNPEQPPISTVVIEFAHCTITRTVTAMLLAPILTRPLPHRAAGDGRHERSSDHR